MVLVLENQQAAETKFLWKGKVFYFVVHPPVFIGLNHETLNWHPSCSFDSLCSVNIFWFEVQNSEIKNTCIPIRFYIAEFEIINRTFCANCRHVCGIKVALQVTFCILLRWKALMNVFSFFLSHKTPQRIPGKITLLLCLKEIRHPFIAQYLVTPIPISHGTREM